MKPYNFCNNCGKNGHLFHLCKNPITSIGIIGIKQTVNGLKYLMIRRKDSLGYIDFMRGKYPIGNKSYLINILKEMTTEEKEKLLKYDFDTLWKDLWGENLGIQYRHEERISRDKYNNLKNGLLFENKEYNLESLIKDITTTWNEPEWGFPKGRRNFQEKDLPCALREFSEETGYKMNQVKIIQNIIPFEEIFTGSNLKSYKHKYYVAFIVENNENPLLKYKCNEVSKIDWYNYTECLSKIRSYNLEKKNILKRVDKLINNYRLY